MKFNFRKIASVLTSAVMLSSTVALAAAANFPAPFVQNGAGDYAVVYGSTSVSGTDNIAAADINSWLTAKVTTTSAPVTATNSTPTDGDFVQIQRSNDKFNLGNELNDFQSSLDAEDLPVILADGTYENDASDEFEYEQSISLGAIELNFQQDNRFNGKVPWVGFDLTSGQELMTYTLDFTDPAESVTWASATSELKGTVLKMLGRDYYISDVSYTDATGVKLTLLDTANSVRIAEGETQTITVGDKSYEIKVLGISDDTTDSVSLSVNGVELSSELEEGDTAKVKGEETYVGVKTISTSSKESIANTAVVTIGTGQLVLENGEEVELNGELLSDLAQYEQFKLTSTIVNSSFNVEQIKLNWTTNDNVYLKPGTSLTMPGFEAVKLSMGDFIAPTAETTSLDDDDDSLRVSTQIEDGSVDFSVFYGNATNILGLGRAADEILITNDTAGHTVTTSTQQLRLQLDVDENTMFAATWVSGDEAESYIYRLKSVSSTNETVLENMASGGSDLTFSEVTDTDDNERMTFTLIDANAGGDWAIFNVTQSSGGLVYLDRVVTKAGLQFKLPLWNSTTGDIYSGNTTQWVMNFTEENADSGNIGEGVSFDATLAPSDDGAEVTTLTDDANINVYDKESNSDIEVGYVISDLATYVEHNDEAAIAETLDISYHDDEAYAQVYVTESKVTLGAGGGGSNGWLPVRDTEVSGVQGKNLIVVGGSCVNTVAAKLLGSETPLCEAAWMTASGNVGAGSFLIKTFDNPWTAGKVATLVAGYDSADTTNAVNALKVQTVDTTVGKAYVGRAGAALTLVG